MTRSASFQDRDGLAIRTPSEVAAIMGLSVQSVRQIEARALWKVRKGLLDTFAVVDGRLVDTLLKSSSVPSRPVAGFAAG